MKTLFRLFSFTDRYLLLGALALWDMLSQP